MRYTFVTERGKQKLSYAEYLRDVELAGWIADPGRLMLNLGATIVNFSVGYLKEHKDKYELFLTLREMQMVNPLQFFMPSALDRGETIDFLNGRKDIKMLIAGNRRGKTATGIVDVLLSCIPTEKSWPIFGRHGIEHRKFRRPMDIGLASTMWTVVERVLWPEVMKWIPRYELGKYNPLQKGHKIFSKNNPVVRLRCGTTLYFFCYEQDQAPFEGQALDIWYWDEQGEESKFHGADERLRTKRGRHVFGLTPHKVEGRADTGARSWIHDMFNDARESGETQGHSIGVYNIGVDDTPDWVYPEVEKKKAYKKWVETPERLGNIKMIKEGRSRYYGEWHETSGLVYDEFDERYHIIDRFKIPDTWTRYRAVDHGSVNPTACLWGAMSPDGDLYLYREYYMRGLTIRDNVRNIVKLSGNRLKEAGQRKVGDIRMAKFEEVTESERYHKTVLDSRSRGTKDPTTNIEYGEIYKINGLRTMAAVGGTLDRTIPIVKEMMAIDAERQHPVKVGISGSPKIFIFRDLVSTIREIRGYAYQEYRSSKDAMHGNAKETPVRKDDHLMDAMRYMCCIPPRYLSGRWGFYTPTLDLEDDEEIEDENLGGRVVVSRKGVYSFINKGRKKKDGITGY